MASETIDRLEVEVTATAKGTAAIFSQLESQLGVLKKAFDAIDTSKLSKIQKAVNAVNPKINTSGMSKAERDIDASIKKIQQSMAGLKSYADKAMSGDKSAFSTYDKQATSLQSTMDKLSEKFKQLGNQSIPTKAFESIDKQIEDTRSHLESLKAKEREAWDSGGKGQSTYDMVQLGSAIQEAEDKLKSLGAEQDRLINEGKAFYDPFEPYRESLDQVQAKLSNTTIQVQNAMAEIGNTKPQTNGVDSLIAKLQSEIPASISKIEQAFAGLGAYANAAIGGDKSAFNSFERQMSSIQSAIDVTKNKFAQLESAGISTAGLENYKNALQSVQAQLNTTASKVRNAYAEMSKSSGVSEQAEKASSSMRSISSSRSGLEALNKTLGKIKDSLKGISLHGPNVGNMFKTILKYGFGIRSLYVLFRRLRKAVVESFGELQNSGAFFETTRANIEALKSSLSTLKFQFGAAFEPIFNAVAPALETFVNYLITVMNVISAFMAKLTGKSTYSKVSATFGKVASGAGGAGKAVKELNKQLQGFDELNNLTEDKPGGGGGGGGGGAGKGGATYVEESVDSVLGDFGKQLADKIREGDWESVGQVISDKLSDVMESIPWDDIFNKARDFGTKLANFLNGLINPRLFENIGTTIGNSINTGLIFFDSWGKGMDWVNVGVSLAAGFDALVHSGWIGQLGETLHTWIAGGLTAATTFFETADFEELGKQIAEFIGNLDIPDLASKLYNLAKSILLALADAIKGFVESDDIGIGEKLGVALVAVIGIAKLTGLTSTLGGLIKTSLTGQTVTADVSGFTLALTGITFILSGIAIAKSLSTMENEIENNPFEMNEETREQDWIGLVKAGALGTLGLQGLSSIPALLSGGKKASILGALTGAPVGLAGSAAIVASGLFGAGMGTLGAKAYAVGRDDEEMADYIDRYGIINHPLAAGKEIIGGIEDHTFGRAWADMSEYYFGPVFEAWGEGWDYLNEKYGSGTATTGSILGDDKNIWQAILNGEATPEQIYETLSEFQKVKEIIKKSGMGLGLNDGEGLDFSDLTEGGTSILGAFKGLSKENSILNKSFKTLGNTVKGTKKRLDDATNSTREYGAATVSVTKGINDSFATVPDTMKGVVLAATTGIETSLKVMPKTVQTYSDNAWKNIKDSFKEAAGWSRNTSAQIGSGFNDLPTKVESTFKSAYDKGTSQFANTETWAFGRAVAVVSNLKDMPEGVRLKFRDAYDKGTSQFKDTKTWIDGVVNTIKKSAAYVPTDFNNIFALASNNATKQLTVFTDWFNGLKFEKTGKLTIETPSKSSIQDTWNGIAGVWKGVSASFTITADADIDDMIWKVNNYIIDPLNVKLGAVAAAGLVKNAIQFQRLQYKGAQGGVVTSPTGVLAGDAGPEALVPLEKNTEWLGKMANMMVGEMAKPQYSSVLTPSYSIGSSNTTSDLAEQNELLREEVQLLRQIANKEVTISSREVFKATRDEANNYYNRTGASPFFN